MLYLAPLLTANMDSSVAEYRIVSVERQESFAGRLGRRVQQTLIVEKDGKRYEIRFGRSHTAINRSIPSYSAGQTIELGRADWGTQIKEVN